jgi:hypothetical protein
LSPPPGSFSIRGRSLCSAARVCGGRTWAAKQVGVCCPRQNGKNAILEARQLAGLFIFNEKLQRYTAHLTDTADTAFRRLSELIEGTPWLADELHNVWKANGKAAIELKNGNRIQFRTRTDRAGRGPSPTTLYFDEAMDISVTAVTAQIPSLAAQSMSEARSRRCGTRDRPSTSSLSANGMVFALCVSAAWRKTTKPHGLSGPWTPRTLTRCRTTTRRSSGRSRIPAWASGSAKSGSAT